MTATDSNPPSGSGGGGGRTVPARGRVRRRLADSGAGVARRMARLPNKLPPEVRREVAQSVTRLARVRTVKGAQKVVVAELERLFVAVTPLLAAAPLPVTGWAARLAAGTAGGAGAAVEQAEEIATVISWGGALPGAPAVMAAMLSAWLLELWIAVSARVNQVKVAGRQVDPELLGRELAGAYLGNPDVVRRDGKSRVMRAVAVKAAERWAAGLVPGVGIVFDAFASQRTVARILRLPVTAHPAKS